MAAEMLPVQLCFQLVRQMEQETLGWTGLYLCKPSVV